ncbi:ABC transporter permease [Microbacterium abyssi]|uniref:ABC transporter permease n=1 Tax=Microbacterium abyssi TaxID=2782166 RepID=UPI001E33DEAA|nr:ABC transporter permease [Microbacterium sp. A18JL241]
MRRNLHSLWVLSARDLRVRYATSWLGYLWSVLDPLVMSLIYWFVFTEIFHRSVGSDPYIVFLIAALLPWVWFNACISDFTHAFQRDAKLVRSTSIPRVIWVGRIILSKGIEFLLAVPVLVLFVVFSGAEVTWGVLWFPVAIILQTALLAGLGLILAPLCVLFDDLERTTRLVLRALFYATPIIYSANDLPAGFSWLPLVNPLDGIFSMYRAAFFPEQWNTASVIASVVWTVVLIVAGVLVFRRLERSVLKEL